MALKKAFRIVQKKEFGRIARTGKTVGNSFLFIRRAPNEVKRNRFGFSVSTRVSAKAVVRNALKRLFAECAQPYARAVPRGHDTVVIAKPEIVKASRATVRDALGKLLQRTNQIK